MTQTKTKVLLENVLVARVYSGEYCDEPEYVAVLCHPAAAEMLNHKAELVEQMRQANPDLRRVVFGPIVASYFSDNEFFDALPDDDQITIDDGMWLFIAKLEIGDVAAMDNETMSVWFDGDVTVHATPKHANSQDRCESPCFKPGDLRRTG